MAVVYLAHDLKHDRPVAIKVVRPEIAYGFGTERFLREIQIAARLQHPLILAVIDSGQTDEPEPRPYYVMPYVEGETLRERLTRDGPLPVEVALPLVKEIGEALEYAHREGVIHRDVKPENVLLFRGHALVADFGIARAARLAGDARLTETGTSLGTPAYMSPEQAGGTGEVDARSDQYSLSCVCYEILCGQPPFTGATAAAVLAAKLTEPVASLARRRPELPAGLTAAVHRGLARAPAERFESVGRFLEALGSASQLREAPARSLLVLPFTNLSPDPDNEWFGDGLTEELIADLSKIRELKVIARNSAMRLKGTAKDAPTLGRELNVRYVLGGSVRKAGPSLRITAQLSDAKDDSQVWAEKYAGTMDDVFDLQERLSRQIVAALKLTLTAGEQQALGERPIKNPVAHELYLKARQDIYKTTKPSLERAISFLRKAEEVEGPNLRLTTTIAFAYWYMQEMGWETSLDLAALSQECLNRARMLDPTGPETDYLEGMGEARRREFIPAVYRMRRALVALPTHPDLLLQFASYIGSVLGQADRARPAAAKLRELDPLSLMAHGAVAIVEIMSGRYVEALADLETGLAFEPDSFDLRIFHAWALALCGHPERAAAVYRDLAEESRAWSLAMTDWCLVCTCAAEGDAAGVAAAATPSAAAFLAKAHPLWAIFFVEAHAMVGLKDEAMEWLERLFTWGFAEYPHLTRSPLLANLRGFPRFEQFLPVAKAKWEDVARQLADLPPL